MAEYLFHFPHKLNESLQVGDAVYWVRKQEAGSSGIEENTTAPKELGTVLGLGDGVYPPLVDDPPAPYQLVAYTYQTPVVLSGGGSSQPGAATSWLHVDSGQNMVPADFYTNTMLLFAKDNVANLSDITGYYALVSLSNDSNEKAELFQVGSGIFESGR